MTRSPLCNSVCAPYTSSMEGAEGGSHEGEGALLPGCSDTGVASDIPVQSKQVPQDARCTCLQFFNRGVAGLHTRLVLL